VTARAGWYPDPAGRPARYRWWDGSAWTRFLATDPAAQPPGAETTQVTHGAVSAASTGDAPTTVEADSAGPDGSDAGREQVSGPGPWQRAGAVVAAESQAGRVRPPGYEPPTRPDGTRPFSLKSALIGVGAVVLIGIIVLAVALYGRPSPVDLQPPPPVDDGSLPASASPSADPSEAYDPVTRKFAFDGLQITIPGEPYTVGSTEFDDLGGTPGVSASVSVHENYNGKGSDWRAALTVGRVPKELAGTNLTHTADKIITSWQRTAFDDSKVTIKNLKKSTLTKNLPRPARIITADMHYKVKGVKSSYDRVSLLVAKGPSGEYVAFLSSRPNDADAGTKKAVQDSIKTVQLT
jgi:hypothetical protein